MIKQINSEWADKILIFIDIFPEFRPYLSIASITDKSISEGEWWEPKTMFEYCIYYPCNAGVRFTYTIEQYKKIILFLRSGNWEKIYSELDLFLEDNKNKIQPKKKQIYRDIFLWMYKKNIRPENLTLEHVELMKKEIKGLGVSFIGFMREQFSDMDNICQYTDKKYIKSYKKLYGEKSTKKEMKQKFELWTEMGFGRVSASFFSQIYDYGQYCE